MLVKFTDSSKGNIWKSHEYWNSQKIGNLRPLQPLSRIHCFSVKECFFSICCVFGVFKKRCCVLIRKFSVLFGSAPGKTFCAQIRYGHGSGLAQAWIKISSISLCHCRGDSPHNTLYMRVNVYVWVFVRTHTKIKLIYVYMLPMHPYSSSQIGCLSPYSSMWTECWSDICYISAAEILKM